MKKFFYLCQFFAAFGCIVYFFSSCAATITVTGSDTSTGNLTLVDSKGNPATVFDTVAGKSIKWKIRKTSGVSSIKDIEAKPGSDNIFKKEIQKKHFSRSWKGTVENFQGLIGKDTTGGYFKEDYYIEWKDSNGTIYKYDPRIQVKS